MSDYTHSNATISNSNKINPVYPVNEKLTEDYIHKLITDDVLSIKAQKGKIPVADPETGMIDSSWLGIDPNASYAVDATTARKGIIEIATNAEAITGTDTERAVTPAGVKASIDNSFTTNKATTTQAGTVILSNLIDNSQDKAVTPYAVKNYLASSNFARAGYNVTGVTPYASVTNVSGIISESKTKPINTLKNDTRYKEVAVDPYSLYNYISNNDMYLNVNRQSVGGIIFRELVEDDSSTTVTATEKARLYVNKDTGNTYLKVGSKTLTLLDTAGNITVPTSVITPVIKNSSGDAPKLGTKQIGSASQPIYIASDGTITKCNTIDNVNNAVNATNATNATTASKLGSSDVGSSTKPIYLAKGVATASNSSIGNANTPVYMNAGTITSTGKSFANYLPLAGGDMTGPIFVNYSSQTTGVKNAIWGQMANNDQWGIRVGTTASDSGYLEIATGDNANEPIYVRQYSGGNFNTLSRTATLLDASGNTSFPGSVTATSFNGPATKLGTATIGSITKPIYLNGGTATASNATVGSTTKPIYMNAGVFTASNTTVGSTTKPIYMNSGTLTASNASVGSKTAPVYMTGGTITACTAVDFAHGGTGATSRLAAAKALTNENVGSAATHFVTLTSSWGKFGYSDLASIKSALALSNTSSINININGIIIQGGFCKGSNWVSIPTPVSSYKTIIATSRSEVGRWDKGGCTITSIEKNSEGKYYRFYIACGSYQASSSFDWGAFWLVLGKV